MTRASSYADIAWLRAERAGTGSGRVYTLTYVGRDAAGNQRTCTTTVTVPRDCKGAYAVKAARNVQKARRKAARNMQEARRDAAARLRRAR